MKHINFIFISLLAFTLISCKSKEEKAEEFIKNELSKTLLDFDSYQPIETIVTEAKETMFNDSACWSTGVLVTYAFKQVTKSWKEAEEAKEHMDIWGSPTSYSSLYSDNQYYKYRKEAKEAIEKGEQAIEVCKILAKNLDSLVTNLDTTKVIGWEVKHRFRCKTRGGNSTIGDYRYILDKDFKKQLFFEDMDDETTKDVRDVMKSIREGSVNL